MEMENQGRSLEGLYLYILKPGKQPVVGPSIAPHGSIRKPVCTSYDRPFSFCSIILQGIFRFQARSLVVLVRFVLFGVPGDPFGALALMLCGSIDSILLIG